MREEFELMGQDFDTRGKRLNEMIPAMRALWRGDWVSWSGEHYQVPELMVEPHPRRPCPSCAAVNRTRRFGVPPAVRWLGRLRVRLGRRRRLRAEAERVRREYGRENEPFDVMLALLELRHRICTSVPRTSASPR